MGINGLLPLLKDSIKQVHVSSFRGQRVAVDSYCWLHRATYGCGEELLSGDEVSSTRWIQYCMSMIDMLLAFDIKVTLVFDGKNLPAKEKTEEGRAATRSKNLTLAREEKRKGNSSEARSLLARAVDVTPRMAAQLIQAVKRHRSQVQFIVAPYEADAQLSYLSKNDLVDAVISEDSDCIPYGCKSILFKLDKKSGFCSHLTLSSLKTQDSKGFDLHQFNDEMLVTMCVAAGCDYVASPKNFGIKSSRRLVAKLKNPCRVIRSMKFDGIMPLVVCNKSSSDDCIIYEYEVDFYKAFMTFHHQTVFDPVERCMKPLHPFLYRAHNAMYPSYLHMNNEQATSQDFPFLGKILTDNVMASGIADGVVDPITMEPFNLPEPIENVNHLNRRHSDSDSYPPGGRKRLHRDINVSATGIKRRRSTGTSYQMQASIESAASEPVMQLGSDGILSKRRQTAPKITAFFSRKTSSSDMTEIDILDSQTSSSIPPRPKRSGAVTATTSCYFKHSKNVPSIPISESLKKVTENNVRLASERISLCSDLDTPRSQSDEESCRGRNIPSRHTRKQPSEVSSYSPTSVTSWCYDDSLSPPIGVPGPLSYSQPDNKLLAETSGPPVDLKKFAYGVAVDNPANKVNCDMSQEVIPEEGLIDLTDDDILFDRTFMETKESVVLKSHASNARGRCSLESESLDDVTAGNNIFAIFKFKTSTKPGPTRS